MFSIQMIIYMAIVLYAPALALSQVTGLHVWFSVLSIGIVCTFYTTIGGIKAVVWTDLFQVLMMFISMMAIVIKGAIDVGGFDYVWKKNAEGGRIEFFNFDTDITVRHTVWGLAIGGYFNWVAIYGCNQAMVQRYLTLPNLKAAQKTIWLNLPGLTLLLIITCFAGMVIYAKYFDCDPILTKQVAAADQLFPLFVMDTLGFLPGLPGLFVSGIFSGALSTVSSGVNSLAAVTLEDLVKAYFLPNISDIWATRITKILALSYGVIAIVLVVVAQKMGNVLQAAISVFGVLGGPQLGMFTLGIFFPWANSSGAAIGMFSALAISLWIGIGKFIYRPYVPKAVFSVEGCQDLYLNVTQKVLTNSTKFTFVSPPSIKEDVFPLYKLSYMWYSVVGCVVAVVVGLLVSCCTGANKAEDVDPKLISPIVKKIYRCLPGGLQRKLQLWDISKDPEKKGKPGVSNLSYVASISETNMDKKQKHENKSSTAHTQM